ncbi:retrovirus-related pol polyprotein from transposon TNT 1-94 [Tanacetum coccineum]
MGLWYPKDIGFELTAFSDSDHATSGGIQFLGGDKLVSWSSKKQDCTLMSSAKAEYVSLSACCTQAAIAISCNPVQHSRTKHIDVRYHFIKEQVEKSIVECISNDIYLTEQGDTNITIDSLDICYDRDSLDICYDRDQDDQDDTDDLN